MRVRKALHNDVQKIVELGVEFGVKTQSIHRMSVNASKIYDQVLDALSNPNLILFVLEVDDKIEGVIFGAITSAYFSDDLVLQELALYSRKATGGLHLIEAFEQYAHNKGITRIVLGSKPTFCDLGKLYTRRGYDILETHFIKGGL